MARISNVVGKGMNEACSVVGISTHACNYVNVSLSCSYYGHLVALAFENLLAKDGKQNAAE